MHPLPDSPTLQGVHFVSSQLLEMLGMDSPPTSSISSELNLLPTSPQLEMNSPSASPQLEMDSPPASPLLEMDSPSASPQLETNSPPLLEMDLIDSLTFSGVDSLPSSPTLYPEVNELNSLPTSPTMSDI